MDRVDPVWLEALAGAQAAEDGLTRDDAYEVFLAEAARCRLADRVGPASWQMTSGTVIRGQQTTSSVAWYLCVRDDAGEVLLATERVISVTGGSPSLRREATFERTLASVLRDAWGTGGTIRALLADGSWRQGELDFVGADHATLRCGDMLLTVPFGAVEAWRLS